ncbi:sugar porter family MFS transporter [Streptomyces reniochalinae]|uniref:Sugar porter family MFS transporter n=1 Tax=Streptomyces reniochalinae TaxID=2250578 RepID=A0A367ED98_9ACTN|nr:sugar porter family MFS transporter [Streptomyces reniochalinae]RCG16048.1 sugar porter family MFS transporter [Streptomyces reniochalinae]
MPDRRSQPEDPGDRGFGDEPKLSPEEQKLSGIPAETASSSTRNIYYVAFVAALGGLLYGYDTGVISGTLDQIAQDFGITKSYELFGATIPRNTVEQMITSSILLGAVIGALVAGPFTIRFGRRGTIITVAAIFGVGVILAGLSPEPLTLIGSRLLLGLAVGGSTQTIPTYIAELSPPDRRGGFVTFFNVAIGIGILSAALVNVIFRDVAWHWKIMVAVVPAVFLIIGILLLPESPRWLVHRNYINPARRVLRWVRPSGQVADREVRDIQDVMRRENEAEEGPWRALGEKWLRPALIAGIAVAIFTQITGLEMMIYYTPVILTDVGFPSTFSLQANVYVGVVYVVMTLVGKLLVDRIGRRRLMLTMLPGSAVSIALFGLLFIVSDDQPNRWLALAMLLAFMFFQTGGIQVVGWLIGSEVYPLRIRPAATGLHAAALWGSNLLVTSTALTLVSTLTLGGAMLVYAMLNVTAWIVVFFRVPETKGHSLEAIEQSLKRGTFLPKPARKGS